MLQLFDHYRRPLLRYARSFNLGVQESEDVVQDVFLALFRHLQLGRPRDNLTAWLFRVAHNLALKQRRRQRRPWWSGWEQAAVADEHIDPAANPEECLADAEQRRRWRSVMCALPECDQRCVLLRAEGLTYRDIALALGISLGAVAKSMARAMERFGRPHQR